MYCGSKMGISIARVPHNLQSISCFSTKRHLGLQRITAWALDSWVVPGVDVMRWGHIEGLMVERIDLYLSR